jgi:hypothetical protein
MCGFCEEPGHTAKRKAAIHRLPFNAEPSPCCNPPSGKRLSPRPQLRRVSADTCNLISSFRQGVVLTSYVVEVLFEGGRRGSRSSAYAGVRRLQGNEYPVVQEPADAQSATAGGPTYADIGNIVTDGDTIEPLAAAEVDAFCDRLNVRPRSIPPSEIVPIANPEE